MATRRSRSADTYHHGNLRQALLEHAVQLAREGGPEAVVLRDVQRMAAVSNSAAYRHYADRDALLAAVTEYAETRLADAMVARLNAVPGRDPRPNGRSGGCAPPGRATSTSRWPNPACSELLSRIRTRLVVGTRVRPTPPMRSRFP